MAAARCPSVDGYVALRCVETWHNVYIALATRDSKRVVIVIVLVAEEWPEVVAEFDEHATWGRVKRVMERLVEQCGVCDDFAQYDVCKQEESGRAAEIVMGLLGDP